MATKKEIIAELLQTLIEGVNEDGEEYRSVELLPLLKERFPNEIPDHLDTISIYQTKQSCYLAAARTPPPAESTDMEAGLTETDTKFSLKYSVKNCVEENAYRFLKQDKFLIIETLTMMLSDNDI